MDPEEKNLFARVLGLATSSVVIVTLVVLSSVAGTSAYLAFQPANLEASAIVAATASASSTSACEEEITTAAARGTPDTETIVTGESSSQFEDTCVDAILISSATSLSPNASASYKCVGKSANVSVSDGGTITETAVPDPAVPAGTCSITACTSPGANGQSNCISTNTATSLSGASIQSALNAEPNALSSDQGITSFTMNSDGSIVDTSGTANSIPASGLTAQNLQSSQAQTPGGSVDSNGPTAIGETQAVLAQPPQTPQQPADTSQISATTSQTSAQKNASAAASTTQSTNASEGGETGAGPTLPPSTSSGLNGPQPNTPTLNASTQSGYIPSISSPATQPVSASATEAAAPQSWIERFSSTLVEDATIVIGGVRAFLHLGST